MFTTPAPVTGTTALAVFWHHGAPSTGAPPEPLFAAAAERGIHWVSHDCVRAGA
jgi:hypothetical protein